MKKKCIIVGAGSYGQVYAEYLHNEFHVIGFIDDNIELVGKSINGITVLGDFNYLLNYSDKTINVFIPIGNNKVRVSLLKIVIEKGFKTPSYIHPDCKIHESVLIGNCVYVLPGTNIMPFTIINDFVLISMGVNIAHHTKIEQGCFFSQGSNIGANIIFGKNVFCGIGSTVMTGVKEVGDNSIIGAGAVIIKDVPENTTIVGNPGKIIKTTI